jgi:hypothetical protein
MKDKYFAFLVLVIGLSIITNCKSTEVKEVDMDDLLEEELRADPEPFRELKENREEPAKKTPKRTTGKR